MAININEAIESLLNTSSTMWAQFSGTCMNAVTAIRGKPEKTAADLAKIEVYGKKSEQFISGASELRQLADRQQGVDRPQTLSNGN